MSILSSSYSLVHQVLIPSSVLPHSLQNQRSNLYNTFTMVAFYSIIMAGLLSTMAFASPAPAANEPVEFETEFKAIEARQVPEKRCLAIV